MPISFNILERIVRLTANNGNVGTGTIVTIAGEDFVLTANHVVEFCHSGCTIIVESRHGTYELRIIKILRRNDLALITVNSSFEALREYELKVGGTRVFLGEELYFAGFPGGEGRYIDLPGTVTEKGELNPFLRRGIVSNAGGHREIILDCIVQRGFSGGPVFRQNRADGLIPKLIAVVSSGLVFVGDRQATASTPTTIISGFTSCIHVGLAIELVEDELGLKHA